MDSAWIGVIGTVLGVLIGSFVTVSSNEKIAYKNFEVEKLKIQRDYDLERLNYLLKPIIFKYMESDQLRSVCINNGVELFGEGLNNEFVDDINKIINNNPRLISFDIQSRYLDANHPQNMEEFIDEMHESTRREYEKSRGKFEEELWDFSFDNDRKFIDMITKEANNIELRYK